MIDVIVPSSTLNGGSRFPEMPNFAQRCDRSLMVHEISPVRVKLGASESGYSQVTMGLNSILAWSNLDGPSREVHVLLFVENIDGPKQQPLTQINMNMTYLDLYIPHID